VDGVNVARVAMVRRVACGLRYVHVCRSVRQTSAQNARCIGSAKAARDVQGTRENGLRKRNAVRISVAKRCRFIDIRAVGRGRGGAKRETKAPGVWGPNLQFEIKSSCKKRLREEERSPGRWRKRFQQSCRATFPRLTTSYYLHPTTSRTLCSIMAMWSLSLQRRPLFHLRHLTLCCPSLAARAPNDRPCAHAA
jgi:hypothetical protein